MQWNGGGWFGGQIGGTCWMLALVAMGFALGLPGLALGTLCCFLASNTFGILLWRRRDRMRVHPAVQLLMLGMLLGALVAFALWDAAGQLQQIVPPGSSPRSVYLYLLIFPALMAQFHLQEKARRTADEAAER